MFYIFTIKHCTKHCEMSEKVSHVYRQIHCKSNLQALKGKECLLRVICVFVSMNSSHKGKELLNFQILFFY